MTPVESLWIVLVVLFGIVGIVRGFFKELGVTLVLVVLLFGLTRLDANLKKLLDMATNASKIQAVGQLYGNPTVWLVFYAAMIIGVMYIAYQGYVIKYPGDEPKGIQGTLLGLMVGLINGYLFIGTLWYYIDKYKQPLQALGIIQGEYSALAQKLLKILPPDLLNPFLPFLVVFMIILLVVK
jgi:uncharacterized membrane protein required for colicin V production